MHGVGLRVVIVELKVQESSIFVLYKRSLSSSSKFGQITDPVLIWAWAGQRSQQHFLRV